MFILLAMGYLQELNPISQNKQLKQFRTIITNNISFYQCKLICCHFVTVIVVSLSYVYLLILYVNKS